MQIRFQSYLVLSLILLTSCFDPPEFENEPFIEFADIRFIEVDQASDSLILSFNFQDGDGDIGLEQGEVFPPYHEFNFVIDSLNRQRVISRDTAATAVRFSDENLTLPLYTIDPFDNIELFSEFDNRPSYNCIDYFELIVDDVVQDTFYRVPNEFANNIIIDFFRKTNGQYVLINDEIGVDPNCPQTFNARIPIFDAENIGRALSGTINYALLSQGFELFFLSDTIRLEFYIFDRALNRSNRISTPDFVLADITSN